MPAVTPTTPPEDIQATGSWPSYKKPINQFATDANNAMVQLPDIFDDINEHTAYQNEAAQATHQNAQFTTQEADRATGQANDAAASAIAAAGAANFVGLWSEQTGAFAKNQSVDYGTPSRRWRSVVDIPNVAASVPSESNSDWSLELGTAAKRDVHDLSFGGGSDLVDVDWVGSSLTSPGENLIEHSNNFTGWFKVNDTTVDPNSRENQYGELLCDRLVTGEGDAIYGVTYGLSVKQGVTYQFRVTAKSEGFDGIRILGSSNAFGSGPERGVDFNLITGVPSSSAGRISKRQNGFWSCTLSVTAVDTVTASLQVYIWDSGSTTVTGDGSTGVIIENIQVSRGPFLSKDIVTGESAIVGSDPVARNSYVDKAVAAADAIRYLGTQTYTSADEDGSGNIEIPVDFSQKNWVDVDCSDASISASGAFDFDITGLQTAKPATYTIHIEGVAVKNDVLYTLPAGWSLHWHATPIYTNTGGTTAEKRAGHTYITLQTDPLAGQNVNGSYGDSRYYE